MIYKACAEHDIQSQGVRQVLDYINCHAPKNASLQPSPKVLVRNKMSLNTASLNLPAVPGLTNTFPPLIVVNNSCEFVANQLYYSYIEQVIAVLL